MSTGIEMYYNQLCPFFLNEEYWKRAEAKGDANILFYDKRVAREISALYNFYTYNFIKIVNRTDKILIRTDIAGSLHLNPTLPADDGTGTLNQMGTARETSDSPPFSLGLLFSEIEKYKKEHFNLFSEVDANTEDASLFGYPNISQEDSRLIREFFKLIRQSDGGNPGSKSFDLLTAGLMTDYGHWPKKLLMAPDQDYPDGNLFKNSNFNSATSIVSGTNAVRPDDWTFEFNESDTSYAQFSPTLITVDGQKVISIKAGYNNFVPTPKNESLWDWNGIHQSFKMTPLWKREATSPSRYRHNFSSLSGVTINDHTTVSGYTNESFDLSEDYFWNMVYNSTSIDHVELWETDRNTDGALWFDFDPNGTVSHTYGATTRIRHEFGDPASSSMFKQYFSKFKGRYRSNDGTWSNWSYLDIIISEDSPLGVSPNFFLGTRTAPTSYEFQMGQQGGRGKAFRFELEKTDDSTFASKYITTPDLNNRKIYDGDKFTYEINVDSSSVDNEFYMRIGLVNNKTDADNLITYVYPIDSSIFYDEWKKIEVDLSAHVGKFIRRIEFSFSSTNDTIGKCIAYFNEVQFINNYERFCGRQFMIAARYKSINLESPNISNNNYAGRTKPHFKFSMKIEDEFGNISYKLLDMHHYGEQNSLDFKWIKGIVQIPLDANCSELIVGVGIYKNVPASLTPPTVGAYGTINNGGSLQIERTLLEPTSRMYFAGIYSLDKGGIGADFGSNNFIEIDNFGWKAWAIQVLAKYFEAWEGQ